MTHALTRFRWFAEQHDELPAFHAASIVAVLLAALLFNVGMFFVLVAGHMALDITKYRSVHRMGWGATLRATVQESIVDLGLLSFAMVLAIYLHHGGGIAAIGGILRSEAFIIRTLGMLLPKAEVLCHLTHIFTDVRHHLRYRHKKGWTRGERVSAWLLSFSLVVLVLAPVLMPLSHMEIGALILQEILPWEM